MHKIMVNSLWAIVLFVSLGFFNGLMSMEGTLAPREENIYNLEITEKTKQPFLKFTLLKSGGKSDRGEPLVNFLDAHQPTSGAGFLKHIFVQFNNEYSDCKYEQQYENGQPFLVVHLAEKRNYANFCWPPEKGATQVKKIVFPWDKKYASVVSPQTAWLPQFQSYALTTIDAEENIRISDYVPVEMSTYVIGNTALTTSPNTMLHRLCKAIIDKDIAAIKGYANFFKGEFYSNGEKKYLLLKKNLWVIKKCIPRDLKDKKYCGLEIPNCSDQEMRILQNLECILTFERKLVSHNEYAGVKGKKQYLFNMKHDTIIDHILKAIFDKDYQKFQSAKQLASDLNIKNMYLKYVKFGDKDERAIIDIVGENPTLPDSLARILREPVGGTISFVWDQRYSNFCKPSLADAFFEYVLGGEIYSADKSLLLTRCDQSMNNVFSIKDVYLKDQKPYIVEEGRDVYNLINSFHDSDFNAIEDCPDKEAFSLLKQNGQIYLKLHNKYLGAFIINGTLLTPDKTTILFALDSNVQQGLIDKEFVLVVPALPIEEVKKPDANLLVDAKSTKVPMPSKPVGGDQKEKGAAVKPEVVIRDDENGVDAQLPLRPNLQSVAKLVAQPKPQSVGQHKVEPEEGSKEKLKVVEGEAQPIPQPKVPSEKKPLVEPLVDPGSNKKEEPTFWTSSTKIGMTSMFLATVIFGVLMAYKNHDFLKLKIDELIASEFWHKKWGTSYLSPIV